MVAWIVGGVGSNQTGMTSVAALPQRFSISTVTVLSLQAEKSTMLV